MMRKLNIKKARSVFIPHKVMGIIRVVIVWLFIASAIMIPSIADAQWFAVLSLSSSSYQIICKNSTLPSYRKMKENRVEHVSPENHANVVT